jgi:hypothetical protein
MALAHDKGRTGFALRIERTELLLEPLIGRFADVDCANRKGRPAADGIGDRAGDTLDYFPLPGGAADERSADLQRPFGALLGPGVGLPASSLGEHAATGQQGALRGVLGHDFDTTGVLGLSYAPGVGVRERGFPAWATVPGMQWLLAFRLRLDLGH